MHSDRLLDIFFSMLAVILSGLYEQPRRKDSVTEKSIKNSLRKGHHFLFD